MLQTLRITIPYLLPSLGAVYSEKGGVVNIALEGILLCGAFAAAAVTYYTGNVIYGAAAGTAAGIFISLIHSIVTVTFKANQIVSGIALNIFAYGLTKIFMQAFIRQLKQFRKDSGAGNT